MRAFNHAFPEPSLIARKMQLALRDWFPMEAKAKAEILHGVIRKFAAGSITYDSREILAAFGEAYKIEYPMLSDAGSKVIRAFGILNTNVPEDHKMMYGMPFPGDYLLTPDGIVRDKRFLPSYEYRPSATGLALRNAEGAAATNSVEIDAGALSATVTLSADRCFPGQELATALLTRLRPGWH